MVRRFIPMLALGLALAWLAAGPSRAAQPRSAVEGDLSGPLRQQIQQAVGETRTPVHSALEARRRARDAASAATALLRSEGYYDSTIEPDVTSAEPPGAVIRVTPGPRFHLAPASVEWEGDPPAADFAKSATLALQLTAGAPGRAPDILAAEGRAVADLERAGFADAVARPREVVVDYADQTVTPHFRIDAGERVRLGAIVLTSRGRSRPAWVKGLAPWRRGDIYDPARIAKLEQRLLDTGVYDSATVSLAPKDQKVGGLRPVIVTLVDRPGRTIEIGGTYSTSQGSGVDPIGQGLGSTVVTQGSGADAKWIFYNRFGLGDTLTASAHIYDVQQKLDLELGLPHWRRPDQILRLGVGIVRDVTPAYNDAGGGLRLEVDRHWTKTTFVSVGGTAVYQATEQKNAVNPAQVPVGETLHLFVFTPLVGLTLDRSNNFLNPTRGWRFDARGEPTFIAGDRDLVFLRSQAQITGYLPLESDARTVLAGRIKIGEILGGSIPNVPADRRFYSGGGGSVRGYGFQQVGPRLSDNTPEGGVSLAEASFEVRQRLTSRWGLVAFADAGTVGVGRWPGTADAGVGAGIGVRYDLGFGPFRLDLATPVIRRQGDSVIQVYLSIGQSF